MTRIREYHLPSDLAEALSLLGRSVPTTRPLGGGTHYRRGWPWPSAVVDLSALKLDGIDRGQDAWAIGASATLAQLAADETLPLAVRRAALRQAPRNSRQRATIGGAIATRDSGTLLVCLLALEARLMVEPGSQVILLQSYLQDPRKDAHLITACYLPHTRMCAFEEISRTPADAPALAVAVGAEVGETGLARVIAVVGGADQPVMVLPEVGQFLEAAADPRTVEIAALAEITPELPWRGDARGSADYRTAMTPVLLKRAMFSLASLPEVYYAG